MKTLKIIFGALFIASTLSASAQTDKTTLEMLMQNKWETVHSVASDDNLYVTDTFTSTEYIETISLRDGGKEAKIIQPYYLSDTIETSFDHSKVGKISSGRYVITFNRKQSKTSVREILKLTETKLVGRGVGFKPDGTVDVGPALAFTAAKK